MARRESLGASDVAKVLGVGAGTAWEVYASKVLGVESDLGEPGRWGLILEGPIVDEWMRRQAAAGSPVVAEDPGQFLRHPVEGWAHASPDRIVWRQGQDGPDVVQVKTSRTAEQWGRPGPAIPDTEPGGNVPAAYYIQVLWEMWVAGATYGAQATGRLVALIGGQELREYQVEWDRDLVQAIVARCRDWWHRHITSGIPPPVDDSAACNRALAAMNPTKQGVIELPGLAADLQLYRHHLDHREAHHREARAARNRIVRAMGTAWRALVTMPSGDRMEVSRSVRQGEGGTYCTIDVHNAPRGRRATAAVGEDEPGCWSLGDFENHMAAIEPRR